MVGVPVVPTRRPAWCLLLLCVHLLSAPLGAVAEREESELAELAAERATGAAAKADAGHQQVQRSLDATAQRKWPFSSSTSKKKHANEEDAALRKMQEDNSTNDTAPPSPSPTPATVHMAGPSPSNPEQPAVTHTGAPGGDEASGGDAKKPAGEMPPVDSQRSATPASSTAADHPKSEKVRGTDTSSAGFEHQAAEESGMSAEVAEKMAEVDMAEEPVSCTKLSQGSSWFSNPWGSKKPEQMMIDDALKLCGAHKKERKKAKKVQKEMSELHAEIQDLQKQKEDQERLMVYYKERLMEKEEEVTRAMEKWEKAKAEAAVAKDEAEAKAKAARAEAKPKAVANAGGHHDSHEEAEDDYDDWTNS